MVDAILKDKLEAAETTLKEQTPLPMNTMLEKQPRAEAIQKKQTRDAMQPKHVPPTINPGTVLFHGCILLKLELIHLGSTVNLFMQQF